MKGSQKCCMFLFILFSTTIIIACCEAIYHMSWDLQSLSQEAINECSYYLFWKISMLAHVMYFFISMSCTIISMQYYQDNYQDVDQAMSAIQRFNANPTEQKRKNILKMTFLMLQGLFIAVFGPNLLIQIIIASVNYKKITGGVCQLQLDGNSMFIYSIVGFGIFSIIMTILCVAGLCSCLFMCCEWRKRERMRQQLELNNEDANNNAQNNNHESDQDDEDEEQDAQFVGNIHHQHNNHNNSPQYNPPNIQDIMSDLNQDQINEIQYQYQIANMISESENISRRRSSV